MRSLACLGVSILALAACGERAASDRFVFTAAGDYGTTVEAGATLDLIGRSAARFHLALGDFSYNREPETRWCEWVTRRVGAAFPFMLVPGNHEDDFGEDGHISRFAACLPDRLGVTGNYANEYFFDHAGLARIIMISPDLTVGGEHYYYGDGNTHYRWLVGAIDGARAAGLPWVIVGMHKSCVSVGQYYCRIYSQLMDLLLEKRVDLVLQSHEHSYQRTKQLALGPGCPSLPLDAYGAACVADQRETGYEQGRGSLVVIAGTAGQKMYELSAHDAEAGYFVRSMGAGAGRHGLLRVEVTASAVSAAFIPSTATSDFADAFTIRRRPAVAQ